jgi:hypothetical protein
VDAFEKFAGVRFAGDDRGLAGLSLSNRVFAEIEPQFAFTAVFVHAVALEAVLGQDGADFAIEVNARGVREGVRSSVGGDWGKQREAKGGEGEDGRLIHLAVSSFPSRASPL